MVHGGGSHGGGGGAAGGILECVGICICQCLEQMVVQVCLTICIENCVLCCTRCCEECSRTKTGQVSPVCHKPKRLANFPAVSLASRQACQCIMQRPDTRNVTRVSGYRYGAGSLSEHGC
jgi:hypothetical protein